jgi:hypothetical protein
MAKPIHEMSSWGHSIHQSRLPDEEWAATRELTQLQTKMMRTQAEYLDSGPKEIGRRVGDDRHELFVVCEPAEALVQQFQHLTPELIAVHDLATDSSRRLVAGLAAATGKKVQKLDIRRQGHGNSLATLEFAELAGPGGKVLRVYSTSADADMRQRQLLSQALLGHARLGVVLVGDLPPHALNTAMEPLRDAMAEGPWPNRNLILVPLGATGPLAHAATLLASRSMVNVRVTPQATKPNDAWGYISLAWDRLRANGSINPPTAQAYGALDQSTDFSPGPSTRQGDLDQASTVAAPLPMKPMPAVPRAAAPAAPPAAPVAVSPEQIYTQYVRDCAAARGVISCCVFDLGSQRTLAHAGARPGPATLATRGGAFYDALVELARGLGLPGGQPQAAVTLAGHHVLLRAVPGQPGLMLHMVLDASATDLASVQAHVARLHPGLGTARAA